MRRFSESPRSPGPWTGIEEDSCNANGLEEHGRRCLPLLAGMLCGGRRSLAR